eukprot:scaffold16823_cov17-Tisochrysis_lutea.AAC.1
MPFKVEGSLTSKVNRVERAILQIPVLLTNGWKESTALQAKTSPHALHALKRDLLLNWIEHKLHLQGFPDGAVIPKALMGVFITTTAYFARALTLCSALTGPL